MIDYSAANGIARVALNRPEKRNALNPDMIRELATALDRAAGDDSVRVIVLRGEGRDFCAGLDLASLVENPNPGVMDHIADAQHIADLFRAFRRNPCPIIAAVRGRALGGGAGIATACDLIVAAESAEFRYPEINLGFIAAVVTALLRRSVGEKQAFELIAAGEPLRAADALRIGLVNQVFPDADFDARVAEYAGKFTDKSASALALSKAMLYHMDGMNLDSALQSGVFMNALGRGTADAERGIERFVRGKK